MIRTQMDLFDHFGADDERRFQRSLYKSTECGAWAKLLPEGKIRTGSRTETWTVKFHYSIVGPIIHTVRQAHKVRLSVVHDEIPQHVREFLLMGEGSTTKLTGDQLASLQVGGPILSISRPSALVTFVTFTVKAPVYVIHQGGVMFGSIVEGSDAEATPQTLLFPFSLADLNAALADIESEVDILWNEANG